MKVVVSNDSAELFSFSTELDLTGIMPPGPDVPAVLAALDEAARHINAIQAGPEVPPSSPAH